MAAPCPWVLLCRFPALVPDDAEAEEPVADFSVALRAPPRVTFITVVRRAHPNPGYIDPDPYIIAAGPSGVLFRFATAPGNGPSVDRVLVMAHHFACGQQLAAPSTATAELVPKSAASVPESYMAGTVGLLSLDDGEHYVIAELRLREGRAKLLVFFDDHGDWLERDLLMPLEARGRQFVCAGALTHDYDHLWWFDLSWGLLSCNPVADQPALLFHALPPGCDVDSFYSGLHDLRCVCESDYQLRFVDIIPYLDSNGRNTATMCMWTRIPAADGSGSTASWKIEYVVNIEDIWNNDSYKATMLPEEVPAVVVVSPSNPKLIYFFLKDRLFGVDMREHNVVEFITEQLPGDPELPTEPASHLRVLPWILPPSISEDTEEAVSPFIERCASTTVSPERMD